MELRNLNELGISLQQRFQRDFVVADYILPDLFKKEVLELGEYKFQYTNYLVHISSTDLDGYIPNVWFVIASYFTEYYLELQKYKQLLNETLVSTGVGKDEIKRVLGLYPKLVNDLYKQNNDIAVSEGEAESQVNSIITGHLANANIDENTKSLLIKFVSNYKWWFGGKTIDRGDFYVSPLLSLAKVVNASHSYIADICKFLSQRVDISNALVKDFENFSERKRDRVSCTLDIADKMSSYLTAIRTKPFLLLAGISGTGKSRIVRKLAQATDDIDAFANDAERFSYHSPANFCLIQVKPNWHNSMDVVGFKSNIGKDGEHYEYTPFIEFICKAWQHSETPFFLCLDEMNLAPVEEYFAEFLSAIESRSIDANGSYETDPIIKPFKDFGDKVAFEMIKHLIGEDTLDSDLAKRLYNKGLTLPQNLIVMGTVNMDDTTFSFSRKVLDRAMSIEMNEVDYDAFLAGTTEDDIPVLIDCNELLVKRPIKSQEVKDDINGKGITNFLKDINSILEGTPFKLGYRAANEALLYVAASKSFGSDNIASALDDFTLMKILSRIEGDNSKLKTANGDCILEKLTEFLSSANGIISELKDSKSLAKLRQMSLALERDHFVSFWN